MKLLPIPAFTDNYIWMLHNEHQALVVDPGDAQTVLDTLTQQGLSLAAILVTHHHNDHTGGVDALRRATGAKVYGPAGETMPEPIDRLQQGDAVQLLGTLLSTLKTRRTPLCFFVVTHCLARVVVGCLRVPRHKCWTL